MIISNIVPIYHTDWTGIDSLIDTNGKWVMDNFTFATDSSPVPEPATMLLLSSGLIGLAGFRKRVLKYNLHREFISSDVSFEQPAFSKSLLV